MLSTEEDNKEECKAAQKLRKELEDFVAPTTGFKEKGKAKALVIDSEPTSAKQAFKSTELVDSNSDKEGE
ncbi:hypothetical protein C0995_009478 [Termitomyces sp. Mi166|nr:hypothetical protein C0995_009478 [Termitomyces sp. Mi166\